MDNFRDIKEFGLTVSSDGHYIANTDDLYRFSIQTTKTGYKQIQKTINGKRRTFMVHRLVALAFLKRDGLKTEVNHMKRTTTKNQMVVMATLTKKVSPKPDNFCVHQST